jgi:flavin reductase
VSEPAPENADVTRDRFIEAMRLAATVVSVVTTDGPGGRWGTTVSSMCSVSADPPTVLACINAQHETARAIEVNGVFCVNILAAAHRHVSDVFAGRVQHLRQNKFDCAEWQALTTGSPALPDALVAFDCRLSHSILIGSHRVTIGLVVDVASHEGAPLVYSNRAYRGLVEVS